MQVHHNVTAIQYQPSRAHYHSLWLYPKLLSVPVSPIIEYDSLFWNSCMWCFITDLSAIMNTEWAEKKIKTVPHSAKSISIIDMMETRTILRTISERYPKLKNSEPRPKFTSFIKIKAKSVHLEYFRSYFLLLLFLWVLLKIRTAFKRTIEWRSNCAKT